VAEPQSTLPTGAYITIGLLIALAALLSWLIASYPGNPSQRAGTDDCESVAQQHSQPEHEGDTTGDHPAGFKNDKAAPHDAAADQTKDNIDAERQTAKYNCQLAIYTRDLAYFTKWLVYATTGLIVIGLLQGFFLQRSVRVADRAATEALDAIRAAQTAADASTIQANASTVAADAAMKHVVVAQDTAKRQLRAYVAVEIVGIRGFREGWKAGFTMLVRNQGQTPAYHVRTAEKVDILPRELPENYEFECPFDKGEIVINPHSHITTWASRDNEFTRAEILELSERDDRRVYVFGVVQYTDAFEAKHRTRYCASISARTFKEGIAKVRGREDDAVVGGGSFEYSSEHNDAD
jgi:hypothetical protein